MHEALLWERHGDRILCGLCPNACSIARGSTGTCGVRRNVNDVLVAETYGLVTSVAVDPVEKKPVFHYQPGTLALSLGSVGCSMSCLHCQNWHISRAGPGEHALSKLPPADVPDLAVEHGCDGVAFTYNEPVIWAEYVLDTSVRCHEAGLYTVMVTNGYITEAGLGLLGEHIDVWRVDVKGFSDDVYRKLCRVGSVEPVLRMAERAREAWGMHVEVVTNIVPGYNDDEDTLRAIAHWIATALGPDTPWHVTRFFPYLDLSHVPPTPIETLRHARHVGAEEGLSFVYLGNVDEPGGEDTVCPSCGRTAVRRSRYDVTLLDAPGGACSACGRGLNLIVQGGEGTS